MPWGETVKWDGQEVSHVTLCFGGGLGSPRGAQGTVAGYTQTLASYLQCHVYMCDVLFDNIRLASLKLPCVKIILLWDFHLPTSKQVHPTWRSLEKEDRLCNTTSQAQELTGISLFALVCATMQCA